ncbi:MAG TPA: NADPH:quinone oxidoreductase family protein [Polyangiaceae bacterium]|jgi:NADPH2:quinone reductase|nr:NADPH:quinone oxidoreductase family protein [Polyangiaceae bacterium]
MRAVVVERFMKPSELTVSETAEPALGDDQVLVDVRAAGCNFFDTLLVQGKYQVKPPFPFSPGGEIAGIVREVGARVTGPTPGDRVMAHVGHGGFAERAVAAPEALHPIPDGMSFEQAAAFPIVYGTAYASVVQRGAVRPGETVLVTAAAGGVGLAAVQIARAVGARVIALASGDKLDVARDAGADLAFDYRAEGWIDGVRAATAGRGADVVIENVGGDVFDGCTRCIAWGGRLAIVGFASGRIPEVSTNRVMLKHISLVGVHFGPMYREELHSVRDAFRALDSLFRQGKVTPLVSATMPLERVAEALDALGGRKTVGKVVLTT